MYIKDTSSAINISMKTKLPFALSFKPASRGPSPPASTALVLLILLGLWSEAVPAH